RSAATTNSRGRLRPGAVRKRVLFSLLVTILGRTREKAATGHSQTHAGSEERARSRRSVSLPLRVRRGLSPSPDRTCRSSGGGGGYVFPRGSARRRGTRLTLPGLWHRES